tara:strand:- start:2454 stop:3224 length:771 start_codon:yes stop_codon:yes gene_type:complete
MIQPIEKIKSLLSDEVVTLFGNPILNNAYDEAMKFILSILSNKSVLGAIIDSKDSLNLDTQWTTSTKADWETDSFMKKRRMLKVERKIASTTTYYEGTEVNFLNEDKFNNSSSIYYENNKYKPKWYKTTSNVLAIIPKEDDGTTPDGRIYYITEPEMGVTDNIDTSTFQLAGKNLSTITDSEEDVIFIGIPHEARELVYVQIAINLIQNYMADFVHEEEDTEMVNLLNNHLQSLSLSKKEHLEYVSNKYGIRGASI